MDDPSLQRSSRARPRADIAEADFRPRAPWWGGDLQTIRNYLSPRGRFAAAPASEALRLPLRDGSGDALIGALSRPDPAAGGNQPLVVLLHGLSGSEQSSYMRMSAAWLTAQGFPALRLNLRGAGPSGAHCRLEYNAGRSDDLCDALAALDALAPELLADGICLIGFSLGGNILLKFLGEPGVPGGVRAAVSVSAPIDLAVTSRNMRRPRNWFYEREMLAEFARQCLRPTAVLSEAERAAVLAARSFYQVDDNFIGPRNGFAGADDYYRGTMALPYLKSIRVPTLMIQARNDPMIPAATYLDYPWGDNPALHPLLPADGGHVGFHDADGLWYLRRFVDFLARIG